MVINSEQRYFLNQWFGEGCREVGIPGGRFRKFCAHPRDLINYVELTYSKNYPCYQSVLIYDRVDQPTRIDRIYFDFDAPRIGRKWILEQSLKDALRFKNRIKKKFDIDSLILTSGYGHALYVFFNEILDISSDRKLGKLLFEKISLKLLGVKYKDSARIRFPTLDLKPVGDIKRIARVPFSIHETNKKKGKMEKRLCAPLNGCDDVFIPDLEHYHINGINRTFIGSIIEKIKEVERRKEIRRLNREAFKSTRPPKRYQTNLSIRPCITKLMEKPNLNHFERLVTAFELINLGWSDERILDVFKKQNDFNEKYTRDQLDHARRRGYKRYSCETLRGEGKCVENCSRR